MSVYRTGVSHIAIPPPGESLVDYRVEVPQLPKIRPDLSGITVKWLDGNAIIDSETDAGSSVVFHFGKFMAIGYLSGESLQRLEARTSIITKLVGAEYSYCFTNILAVIMDPEKHFIVVYNGVYSDDTVTVREVGSKRYMNNREITVSLGSYLGSVRYNPIPAVLKGYSTFKRDHAFWLLEQCCLWFILDVAAINLATILVSTAKNAGMSPVVLDISGKRGVDPWSNVEDPEKAFYFDVAPAAGIDHLWGETVLPFYAEVAQKLQTYDFWQFSSVTDVDELSSRRDVCVQYLNYHLVGRSPSSHSVTGEVTRAELLKELYSPLTVSAELDRRAQTQEKSATVFRISTINEIRKRAEKPSGRAAGRINRFGTVRGPKGGMIDGKRLTYSSGATNLTPQNINPKKVYEAGFMTLAFRYFAYRGDVDRCRMAITEIYRLNECNVDDHVMVVDALCIALDAAAIYTFLGANNDLILTVLENTRSWRKGVGKSYKVGFFESIVPFAEVVGLASMCASSPKSRDLYHIWDVYYSYWVDVEDYALADKINVGETERLFDDLKGTKAREEGERYFAADDEDIFVRLGALFYVALTERRFSCMQILREYKNSSDVLDDGRKVFMMRRDGKEYDPVRVILRIMRDVIGSNVEVVEACYMKVKKSNQKVAMSLLAYPILSYIMEYQAGEVIDVDLSATKSELNKLKEGTYSPFVEEDDVDVISGASMTALERTLEFYPQRFSQKVVEEDLYDEVFYSILESR